MKRKRPHTAPIRDARGQAVVRPAVRGACGGGTPAQVSLVAFDDREIEP